MSDSLVQQLLEDVTQAFDRRDYRSATTTLKQLWKLQPQNPWVQLYRGRLYEVAGNFPQATATYKNLLKAVSSPKVVSQARQGLDRVAQLEQEHRSRTIAQSITDPSQQQQGLLVLEAIPNEQRTQASQALAQVMGIDPYSARLQIPNRGWRIYRMGPIGELELYRQQLQNQGIPAFCNALQSLEKPQLFQVQVVQSENPEQQSVELICINPEGQSGVISLNWREATHLIKGRLPIFDRVLEFDILRREHTTRSRKEEIKDYALVMDLHLVERNCILRFCDRTYQFDRGLDFTPDIPLAQTVIRAQWNSLSEWITVNHSNLKVWDEFNAFCETAIEFPHLLKSIDPGFYLQGQENSRTNPTFHLYSLLAFCRPEKI